MARLNPELMRGSLDLMVLSVLAAGPKYGYLVQNELREATGGLIDIQAGTLYPLLHRLEMDKLVRCRWDDSTGRKRRWYEISSRGRKKLVAQAHEWRQYAACIQSILAPVCEPQTRPT
jgi:PadR family transcriptional regulator, regulatory protein PadR